MVGKIPHPFQPLSKTNDPYLIPRKKRVSLTTTLLQTELASANTIFPVMPPYQTQHFFVSFIAAEEQVLELTKGVDTSKAYGYNGDSNRIIKMCSDGFHVYFIRFINVFFTWSFP